MNSRKRFTIAWLVFLGYFAVGATTIGLTYLALPQPGEQDGFYLAAKWIACGDLADYRQTFQHDWGPLYPWMLAAIGRIVGSTHLAGKFLTLFFGSLLVALTYLAGETIFGSRRIAGTAVALLALNPIYLYYATLASTDISAACFIFLGIYLAILAARSENRWPPALLAGLACGAACLIRYQAFAPGLGLLIASAFLPAPKKRPREVFAAAFVLGLILPPAIAGLTGLSTPGDFGGLSQIKWKLIEGLAEVSGGSNALRSLFPGYARSLLLLGWILGFVPYLALIGLRRIPRSLAADQRVVLLLGLTPLIAYFVGVGWYPPPGQPEIRRLFLLFLPPFSLALAAAAQGRTASEKAKTLRHRLPLVLTLGWAVVFFLLEFPYFDLPGGRPWQRWLGLSGVYVQREYPPGEAAALDAARDWIRRAQPGCAPVVTNSPATTVLFPNAVFIGYGVDLTDETLNTLIRQRQRKPGYVMQTEVQGQNHLEPGPLAGGVTLEQLTESPGGIFYRLIPAEATVTP
ncbi:MAG: phospholipid carrier-dependent glycosyltransferase [Myxococcales bacterium]|nr:phospholipid carrier-dependent glycosyltransferase [Myxococcales bacterium]